MEPATKKFVWPDRSALSRDAFGIVRKLRKAGFESYVAGGAVRDALLSRSIADIDIATAATPPQVKKLFSKTIPTGEKHGTITVRSNGRSYEVTTFRKEGGYSDSRHPDKVNFISSGAEDALRRDFTINAVFYDPIKKELIDHVGGLSDSKKKIIRMVGNPEERISEDALRLLRAVRFSVTLGFEMEKNTARAVRKYAGKIKFISAERIKQELDKIICSDRAAEGIVSLDKTGLLLRILPEVKKMQGAAQPKKWHSEGDVYIHTLLALSQIEKKAPLTVRYAVLFHDIGKPATRKIRQGRATFYEHTTVGEKIFRKIAKRLKFSSAETGSIAWLVRYHMVPQDLPKMKIQSRRKWAQNKLFPELLEVFLADAAATFPSHGKDEKVPRAYRIGKKVLQEFLNRPDLADPILNGNEVMKVLRIGPGPAVGEAMRILEEKKLAGKMKTKTEAKKFLRKNKKLIGRTA